LTAEPLGFFNSFNNVVRFTAGADGNQEIAFRGESQDLTSKDLFVAIIIA
jgi:hypothetical protein